MTTTTFYEILGDIDDRYIEQARQARRRKPLRILWAAAAACFVLAVAAAAGMVLLHGESGGFLPVQTENTSRPAGSGTAGSDPGPSAGDDNLIGSRPGKVINSFNAGATASYAFPKPGQCGFATEVRAAMEEYAGQDAAFQVAIDIFKAKGVSLTDKEMAAEYQRLNDLGCPLYLAHSWMYVLNNETDPHAQIEESPYTRVVGIFTAEELKDFPVEQEYGYFFFFLTDGDNRPVSVAEADRVTDFSGYPFPAE